MANWTRKAFAVGLAVVCAGVGTALLMPERAADANVDQPFEPFFPTYPGTRMLPMASAGVLNGAAFQMAYFRAKGTPQDVVRFYENYWKGQKFLVDGAGTADEAHLAALDSTTSILRAVSIKREGDRLMVFCTVMPTGPTSAQDREPVPVPSDAILTDNLTIDGANTTTYFARGSLDNHQKNLEDAFAGAGWKALPSRTRVTDMGTVLEFRKGRQVAMASLAKEKGDRAVAVQIHSTVEEEQ